MSTLHLILSAFSLGLFFIGLWPAFSGGRAGKGYSFVLAIYVLLYSAYGVFYAICYSFTGKGVDHAVLYHIKYGLEGAGYGEYSGLITVALVSLFFSLLLVVIFYSAIREAKIYFPAVSFFCHFFFSCCPVLFTRQLPICICCPGPMKENRSGNITRHPIFMLPQAQPGILYLFMLKAWNGHILMSRFFQGLFSI
jgi:hypothetical protein